MAQKRVYLLLLIISCCTLLGAADDMEKDKLAREHILKAKVIHSITRFVSWPHFSDKQAFNLCIIGNRPTLQNALELFFQRKPVFNDVKTNIKLTTPSQAGSCNLVFIGETNKKLTSKILQQLEGKPVLICADKPGLAEQGVHVNLYVDSNKVRFEVNFESSKKTGLNMSSQLLSYARIVKTRPSYE